MLWNDLGMWWLMFCVLCFCSLVGSLVHWLLGSLLAWFLACFIAFCFVVVVDCLVFLLVVVVVVLRLKSLHLPWHFHPQLPRQFPRLVSLREKLDNLEQKMTVPSVTRNTRFGGFQTDGWHGALPRFAGKCGTAFSRKPG